MTETMDTKDIAEMMGATRQYVTDKMVKQPGFPAPVINRSQKLRRWARPDVERWAAGDQSLEAIVSAEAR